MRDAQPLPLASAWHRPDAAWIASQPAVRIGACRRQRSQQRLRCKTTENPQNHQCTTMASSCMHTRTHSEKGEAQCPPSVAFHHPPYFAFQNAPYSHVPSILCLPVFVPAHTRTRACTLQQRLDAADTRFQSSEARLDAKTKWVRQLEAERDALETSKREVEVRYTPPPWRE
jgi:hypothetical protein